MGFIESVFTTDFLGKTFAFLCALLWAFAVILFKKSGERISPLGLNLYKAMVSSILLIPVLFIAGVDWFPADFSVSDYMILAASGILGIAVADTFFFKSLNLLGAGLTAIMDCFYSPIIILLSFLILMTPVSFIEMTGGLLVIGAILVATLRLEDRERRPRDIFLGFFYGFIAMFTMGYSVIMMKPILNRSSALLVTELRLIAGALALLVILVFRKDRKLISVSLTNFQNWRYAFPGTLLGGFLALMLWVSAFKMTSVNSAAILNQTNTIFIVFFATLFLKEKFTIRKLLATFLGMAGSVVVLLG